MNRITSSVPNTRNNMKIKAFIEPVRFASANTVEESTSNLRRIILCTPHIISIITRLDTHDKPTTRGMYHQININKDTKEQRWQQLFNWRHTERLLLHDADMREWTGIFTGCGGHCNLFGACIILNRDILLVEVQAECIANRSFCNIDRWL